MLAGRSERDAHRCGPRAPHAVGLGPDGDVVLGALAQPEGLDPRLASYQVANMVESMADGFDLLLRADTAEAILDTTAHMVVRLTTGR